jgi:DNA invertase Pin-like site-specific DNA recombinase
MFAADHRIEASRTSKAISSKAAQLGLSWPLESRATATPRRKAKLTDNQRAEAIKRMADGESCRAIARTFHVHHATISKLAR